jgi:hypothetical protein
VTEGPRESLLRDVLRKGALRPGQLKGPYEARVMQLVDRDEVLGRAVSTDYGDATSLAPRRSAG